MYKALHCSPMIPSFKQGDTRHFFKELLGFSAAIETDAYAVYTKENASVHILPAGEGIGQMECYLEIDNMDDCWNRIKDHMTGLKVKSPFNREYGMREIHIEIPGTNTLLFIGQAIHDIH